MRTRKNELDVDFIGGVGPLTKEEEQRISNFIKSHKAKSKQRLTSPKTRGKVTTKTKKRKVTI